jgi:hypothetical protein
MHRLDCIAQQIEQDLLNLDLVDQDKIDVRVEAEPDLDILDPRRASEPVSSTSFLALSTRNSFRGAP